MVWRLLELEKAIIALEIPSAIDGGTSSTSQLSNTKPRAGSGVIVGVTVGGGVAVGVAVNVAVGLAVGLGVTLGMAVGAGVTVSIGVELGNSVGTGVIVAELVAAGTEVAVGWLSGLQAQRSTENTRAIGDRKLSLHNMA